MTFCQALYNCNQDCTEVSISYECIVSHNKNLQQKSLIAKWRELHLVIRVMHETEHLWQGSKVDYVITEFLLQAIFTVCSRSTLCDKY